MEHSLIGPHVSGCPSLASSDNTKSSGLDGNGECLTNCLWINFLDSSLFMRQKTIIVGVNSASSTSLPVISRVPQRSIAT